MSVSKLGLGVMGMAALWLALVGAGRASGTLPFIPVTDWNQRHPWPPIGGLRHLIFHATSNGFDKVIRRVGRRVLIDEAAFFAWVDGNGGAK